MWQVDLTRKLINVYTCLSLVLLARLIFFHRWFYPPALTHLAPSPTRICVFPTLKPFLLFQSRDPVIKKIWRSHLLASYDPSPILDGSAPSPPQSWSPPWLSICVAWAPSHRWLASMPVAVNQGTTKRRRLQRWPHPWRLGLAPGG